MAWERVLTDEEIELLGKDPYSLFKTTEKPMTTSYKAEVTTAGDNGKYSCNALRFATREEANEYGRNLMFRWLAVNDMRVVESDEPVSAQWVDQKVVHLSHD